jgi:protein-S-isoprenylcysteine O-methyltransferase Ste14
MTTDLPRPREVPPVWLVLSLLVMLGLHFWLPGGVWLRKPWTWSGMAIAAAAGVLSGSAASRFQRARTGIKPFSAATTLVTTGAYRWTRNPMYVGLVGITVGGAIALGTCLPALVPVLLLVLLDRRFVRAEEAFLQQRFGAAYDDYRARVRRWL